MEKLPGDYIAGFVDGEGCFALKFRRDVRHDRKNKPVYFYWDIEFAIVLRNDDREILESIKYTLNCGRLNKPDQRGFARHSVTHINDLTAKIVPFFDKHPLYAKKKYDFLLWKEAVGIFKRNQRFEVNARAGKDGFQKTIWNEKDLKRLAAIHEEMKQYKAKHKGWKWLL